MITHPAGFPKPGDPIPSLEDAQTRIADALADAPDKDVVEAAGRAGAASLVELGSSAEIVATVRDPTRSEAPLGIAVLKALDADRAWPHAIALIAVGATLRSYRASIRAVLEERTDRVLEAAARRPLSGWVPDPAAAPWSWPARPLADMFDSADLLVAALSDESVDGLGSQAMHLLNDLQRLDTSFKPTLAAPGAEPAARFAQAARRALADMLDRLPVAVLVHSARRKWLNSGVIEALAKREELKSPEAQLECLGQAVGPLLYPGELERHEAIATWSIQSLCADRYDGAVPILSHLFCVQDRLLGIEAGKALVSMGTPRAHEAMASSLEPTLGRYDGGVAQRAFAELAVAGVLSAAPGDGSKTLGARFSEQALADPTGLAIADGILAARARPLAKPLFDRDPGWLDLAAGLLASGRYNPRSFLASFDPKAVNGALDRAGFRPPGPAPRRTHPLPAAPKWLERYRAGETREVWSEIVALEDSIRDGDLEELARAVAAEIMARVRRNLERIVGVLKARKYAFAAKSAAKALVAPHAKVGTQVAAMSKQLGRRLPIAIQAFYEVVGAVDLREHPEAPYDDQAHLFFGLGAADPLMVIPPKDAADILKEDDRGEKSYPRELRRPLGAIALGLSPKGKIDPDAIASLERFDLRLDGEAADGFVTLDGASIRFVDYLRTVLRRGGFAALTADGEPGAAEQLELLTRDFVEL